MAPASQHMDQDSRSDRFPTEWSFDYRAEEERLNPMSHHKSSRQGGATPAEGPIGDEDWALGPPPGGYFG